MLGVTRTTGSLRILTKRLHYSSVAVNAAAESAVPNAGSSSATKVVWPLSGYKLTYKEYGDPATVLRRERFQIESVPDDHVVVKMLAASVNPADINTIQGTYPAKPPSLPAVPGNEGVGVVIKAVANEDGILEGDWVVPRISNFGTWQAYVHGKAPDFIKLPHLDLVTAATICVNPCTAYRMLKDFETLKPGDCVIQNGGNSAVGQAVIQLCREFGLKCVSLVRPREDFKKLKSRLMSLGNTDTVIITEEDLRSMLRDFKAQLALNCVGGKSATDILRVLEEGRTMVSYGGMSRQPVIAPTSSLIFNNVQLKGFWMTRWNATQSIEARKEMLSYLSSLALSGKLMPPEHKLIPFAKYRDALDNVMKGYSGQKYIIKFD